MAKYDCIYESKSKPIDHDFYYSKNRKKKNRMIWRPLTLSVSMRKITSLNEGSDRK